MDIDKIFMNIPVWLLSRESTLDRFLSPVLGRAQGCCISFFFFLFFILFVNARKQSLFCYLPRVIHYQLSRLPYTFSAWVNSGIWGGWVIQVFDSGSWMSCCTCVPVMQCWPHAVEVVRGDTLGVLLFSGDRTLALFGGSGVRENCCVGEGLWMWKRRWAPGVAAGTEGEPRATVFHGKPPPQPEVLDPAGPHQRLGEGESKTFDRSPAGSLVLCASGPPKTETAIFLTTLWNFNTDIPSVAVVAVCMWELMQHVKLLSVWTWVGNWAEVLLCALARKMGEED